MKSIMQIRQIDDERIKELKHMKNIINKSYQQTNLYICIYIYIVNIMRTINLKYVNKNLFKYLFYYIIMN